MLDNSKNPQNSHPTNRNKPTETKICYKLNLTLCFYTREYLQWRVFFFISLKIAAKTTKLK